MDTCKPRVTIIGKPLRKIFERKNYKLIKSYYNKKNKITIENSNELEELYESIDKYGNANDENINISLHSKTIETILENKDENKDEKRGYRKILCISK